MADNYDQVDDAMLSDGDVMLSDDDVITSNEQLRKQLGDIPLGELQKMKEKMGLKLYNEAIFGSTKQSLTEENENDQDAENSVKVIKKKHSTLQKQKIVSSEPLEVSSKKRKKRPRQVVNIEKRKTRDPRFDDLSGNYNEKCFEKSYSFIDEMRKDEFEKVRKQLKKEKDEVKKKEIHKLLIRMKQQSSNKQQQDSQKQKQIDRKKVEKGLVKQGKKPFYLKKSEKRKIDLVDKYQKLKSTGQLEKYMSKKRKRNATKEKRKLPELKN